MNSIISSDPMSCTGYGTLAPAFQIDDSATNSAFAHLPASNSRPKPVLVAMALVSRDRRTRRPSRYPASRWNIRWSALRKVFTASRQPGPPGSDRSSRPTSASLPVLITPSRVSLADSDVTSQSGTGFGPWVATS